MARVEDEVNYCLRCGTRLVQANVMGRERPVCPSCNWVYYADPKVAVVVVIEQGGKVLLTRRAFNPQRGLWTLPAGYVDASEDPIRAAERECFEETGLCVKVSQLLGVFFGQEHPRGAHIIIAYQGEIQGGTLQPGDDVDQADFFEKSNLPILAFSSTEKIIQILPDLR